MCLFFRSVSALVLGTGLLTAALSPEIAAAAGPEGREPLARTEVLTQPRLDRLMVAPGQEADPRTLFDLMDNHGDGRISREEFNLKRMDAFFIRDANGDQQLSRAEIPGISDSLFAATDKNSDGSISALEFNQAEWLSFDAFDRNGDGFIDFDEFFGYSEVLD